MTEDFHSIISDLPVIDNHCHLFNTKYAEYDLSKILSMSLNDMPQEQLRHTLVYRTMLSELRDFMKMTGSDQDVLEERERRARKNFKGYVHKLFEHVQLKTLLVDLGYEPAQVNLQSFENLVPARVHYMYRIEKSLDRLWIDFKEGLSDFRKVEDQFHESMEKVASDGEFVSLKSVIGYRTGLKVGVVERQELLDHEPDEKTFRDYFLLEAMKYAIDQGIPFQIHAAFGESNINTLENHPMLLKRILDHPLYSKTKIILVHGGYPYCFEAAYLASVFPNVYVDISEMIPFVPMGSGKGLSDIFDMCPFNKILYGSDGFIVPEIHWLGVIRAKKAIAALFSKYMAEGLFSKDYALHIARRVFFDNATEIYGLKE